MTKFPEITPQDAPPEIAVIYSDIRAVTGLPMVNLIWRHIATFPGALAWAWDAVRPLNASRQLASARLRVANSVALPELPLPSADVWQGMGLTSDDKARVAAIVEAYIHGNLTNILTLTALRLRIDHPERHPAGLTAGEGGSRADVELGTLPRLADLDPAVASSVRALAAQHDIEGVIPSLYLEMTPWPDLLRSLPELLAPLYAPAALRSARESVVKATGEEAATIIPGSRPAPPGIDALRPALTHFTERVIPDLIPVCLALHMLLQHDEATSP